MTVNYILESYESNLEIERQADRTWRIYDGIQWRYALKTQEQAHRLAKQFGGQAIGYCLWDDQENHGTYINVEQVHP